MGEKKVTKEQFEEYVSIRDSGVTNMFDINTVCLYATMLTREDCLYIMSNFSELANEYGVEV